MITIRVEGLANVQQMLGDLSHKTPSAVARALTETAKDAKNEVYAWMPRIFDRPTPYTMKSLFMFPAEKNDLRAMVSFKTGYGRVGRHMMGEIKAPRALRTQVAGGKRPLSNLEKKLLKEGITKEWNPYLIPAIGTPKDTYGNVTRGFMNKVLYSGVKLGSASQGFGVPLNNRRQAAAKKGQYFVMRRNFGYTAVGIFKNLGSHKPPAPVFWFSDKAQYKSRLPFYNIVNAVVDRQLNKRVMESIQVIIDKYRR